MGRSVKDTCVTEPPAQGRLVMGEPAVKRRGGARAASAAPPAGAEHASAPPQAVLQLVFRGMAGA